MPCYCNPVMQVSTLTLLITLIGTGAGIVAGEVPHRRLSAGIVGDRHHGQMPAGDSAKGWTGVRRLHRLAQWKLLKNTFRGCQGARKRLW